MFISQKASELLYLEFLSHCVPSLTNTTKPKLRWTTATRTSWGQTSSSVLWRNFSEQPWIEHETMKQRINRSQSWLKAMVDRHRIVLPGITFEPSSHPCLDIKTIAHKFQGHHGAWWLWKPSLWWETRHSDIPNISPVLKFCHHYLW